MAKCEGSRPTLRRRDLLLGAGWAVLAAHRAAFAQPRKAVQIGFVSRAPRSFPGPNTLLTQLAEGGYVEGRNLTVAYRQVVDEPGPASVAAAALVHYGVDLIFPVGPGCLEGVISATRTVPIVFVAINFDPLARGFVASLAHPGGNVTGIYLRTLDLVGKQIELLKEIRPAARRLGILWDAETRDELSVAQQAATALGLENHPVELIDPPYDFDAAFTRLRSAEPELLLVASGSNFVSQRDHIAALALRYRLPTMYKFRDYVAAGGLMSYGADRIALFRRAADLAVRILNGTNPADLPVEEADRFEFVINLKTAKALGLTVPQSLLVRADEVIE